MAVFYCLVSHKRYPAHCSKGGEPVEAQPAMVVGTLFPPAWEDYKLPSLLLAYYTNP